MEAAHSLGSSDIRIMFLEIAPNLIALADRLRHAADPGEHRPRGDALLSRSRDPAADRVMGQHDRRGADR